MFGRHGGTFPSLAPVALASTAAATLTRPAWRHADDARSIFASSKASLAASRCLQSLRLLIVCAISHGSRRTMSPIFPNANLCRLLILPSGECSWAGMMYHSLIARRSEFGVADSRFGLCFPMAWLSMPSTWTLMHARAPANCGCTCFAVAKRYCRSSRKRHQVGALHPGCSGPIHTKAPGCVGPVACGLPSHARGPIAQTRFRLDCCLQCVASRVLGSAADCWSAEWCRRHASREGFDHTTGVENMAPLPTWKTYHPAP